MQAIDKKAPHDPGARAKPARAVLWAFCATGIVYLLVVAGFLAMIWTLFQLLIWVFTG